MKIHKLIKQCNLIFNVYNLKFMFKIYEIL